MEVKLKKNYNPQHKEKRMRKAVQAQEGRISGSQECGHVTCHHTFYIIT